MGFDRAGALRTAEKLLRIGKIEAAIAEYARIVTEAPRDWNTANALGDLYVRTGQIDLAVEQFGRVADGLALEGFLPKASAVYKKILKLQPNHEHALLQSAEIAASLGLMADARAHFGSVIVRRRTHGDARGVAEIIVRLGALEGADLDARLAAAKARIDLGDPGQAARELSAMADELLESGRAAEALTVVRQAAELAPSDPQIRTQLARVLIASGDSHGAAEYVTVETPGAPLDLLLSAAAVRFRSDDRDGGLSIVRHALAQHPDGRAAVLQLGDQVAMENRETGFSLVETVVETLLGAHDLPAALAALEAWCERQHDHIPALMRLVELAIDSGREAEMYRAQARLADAYLAAGLAAQARFITEDLLAHEPDNAGHVERFRRVLELEGEPDPDAVIAEVRAGAWSTKADETFPSEPSADVLESVLPLETHADFDDLFGELALLPLDSFIFDDLDVASPGLPGAAAGTSGDSDHIEIDLSSDLDALLNPVPDDVTGDAAAAVMDPAAPPPPGPEPPAPILTDDIDQVFEQLRGEAASRPSSEAGQKAYERGLALQEAGDIDGCVQALQSASRAPAVRFAAASALARIFRQRGELPSAAEWFERAAEAPTASRDEAHALLYELAEVLEAEGEVARALAVCLELQAEAGTYRDLGARIDRLTGLQLRG